MLRLLIDENFNQRILRGLRLRVPSLDFVLVQETALQGLQDPPLLHEAAVLHRVLVTHDLKRCRDMPMHASPQVSPCPVSLLSQMICLSVRPLSICILWWSVAESMN
jgi:predicted nuclease of predicted toxin-antitoxin system